MATLHQTLGTLPSSFKSSPFVLMTLALSKRYESSHERTFVSASWSLECECAREHKGERDRDVLHAPRNGTLWQNSTVTVILWPFLTPTQVLSAVLVGRAKSVVASVPWRIRCP